jgi:DNA modification methylase
LVGRNELLDLKFRPEPAAFTEWLEGRRPQHLSTNAGTGGAAFQGWRKLKEAFAPELIAQAFEETSTALGRTVQSCIDPFGGSGTTALACQFLGVRPTTIEVNPYLADLIEAKLARYDLEELIADFKTVVESAPVDVAEPFPGAPKTFVEPGVNGRFVFTQQVARRLASFGELITLVSNSANRCLMRVLLGAVALSVSNVLVSGKGRRYRRDWAARPVFADRVDALFSDAVVRAIYEIRRFQDRKVTSYKLIRGDARVLFPHRGSFDLAVFSPPYPNSFDYTDVYNVELWVCGYLKSAEDNRALRLATLRSHVQIARSFENPGLTSATLTRVASELDRVRAKLWDPHIPDMVRAYFADMALVLSKLGRSLRGGGRVYIVVGDSRYGGVQVPVATILSEVALSMGFVLAGAEPFRSMRASPQQGGRHELVETLLTLNRN